MRARVPARYAPEREYGLAVLLGEFLGLDVRCERADVAAIELCADDGAEPLVLPEALFATPEDAWLTSASLPEEPLAEVGGVPLLYGTPAAPDLLGSAFFCLTRYEELVSAERDDRERFPATASIAYRGGFLDRPLVDEYVGLLWQALVRRWPRLQRRARAFRVLPSHDVDHPFAREPRLRTAAADVLKRRDAQLAALRLVRGPRLYETFEWTMDESERRGLRSAFYFIGGHTAGAIDGEYTLADEPIRRILRRIHERGHEIGLHLSYGTFRDPEASAREADTLRGTLDELGIDQPLLGGRQHYLRWENPITWQNWEDAGLAYDSTLGYSDRPGFRCGTCRDFPVFNLRTRRQLALRERPLVAMDVTLLLHLGLDEAAGAAAVAPLREACRAHGGDFTLLWHNNLLASPRARRAYLRALDG
jgi:hypothetical protein